jgi:hypothetical protein
MFTLRNKKFTSIKFTRLLPVMWRQKERHPGEWWVCVHVLTGIHTHAHTHAGEGHNDHFNGKTFLSSSYSEKPLEFLCNICIDLGLKSLCHWSDRHSGSPRLFWSLEMMTSCSHAWPPQYGLAADSNWSLFSPDVTCSYTTCNHSSGPLCSPSTSVTMGIWHLNSLPL